MTQVDSVTNGHYKDWPNTAGFNASKDHRTKTPLVVTGNIPAYAAGVLYRTGPGGYRVPHNGRDISCSHWFDGYTVVHKFDIAKSLNAKSATIEYTSYGQVDDLVEHVRQTGRLDQISFGNKRDPCDGLFRKIKTVFAPPAFPDAAHSANIGVALRDTLPIERKQTASQGGTDLKDRKILTLTTDATSVKQFDADTLEPLGVTDQKLLHPDLVGPLSGAHAAHDLVTGDIFNYNLQLGKSATYRVFKASPSTGEVDILATISGNGVYGAYLHSILLTENFVIICVWPAHYKTMGLSILWNRNILDSIAPFDPQSETKWFVVDRRHGRGLVKTFESAPFFCFHTVNAWEVKNAGGETDVMCELVQYGDSAILHKFYYENMVSDGPGVESFEGQYGLLQAGLARYKLASVPSEGVDNSIASAERTLFIEAPKVGDLPRINPDYSTKPHRYVWTIIGQGKSSFVDGLSKLDTKTGTSIIWEHDKHTPGEPIFVPRPGATTEDDGVLLVVVLDGEKGTSYLLCLDAATMEEVGRADVGYPVGFGFHGTFVSGP